MSKYDYTITFQRNPESRIAIDPVAKYGYWERADGAEGGGLWFEDAPGTTHGLKLVDYDGAGVLPRQIVELFSQQQLIPADEIGDY